MMKIGREVTIICIGNPSNNEAPMIYLKGDIYDPEAHEGCRHYLLGEPLTKQRMKEMLVVKNEET